MALHPSKTKFMIFNGNEQLFNGLNLKLFINNNNDDENFPELFTEIERIGPNLLSNF
jgi:hypothetical protein